MTNLILQYALYLIILVALAIPLGKYIAKVMDGEKVFLSKILVPCENGIYKLMRIDKNEDMEWKKYSLSVILFSIINLVILFLIHVCQGVLPLNPEKFSGIKWDLAFNNAVSFLTNTNWQAYSGESALSYFTQMIGLTVQNFVSPAVGMCVLYGLIRGLLRVKQKGIGNFWVDFTRSVMYILIPLSIVVSLVLVSQGVVQNFKQYDTVSLTEPITLDDGTEVTEGVVPLGPAASQIAIKQLGTNGGGFFGVNSAHPLENPTALSNLFEMLSILLIPVSLCFSFGKSIKDKKQGVAIFVAMAIMLVAALGTIGINEQNATPQIAGNGQINIEATQTQSGGNMEGKESRFGIASSTTWAAFTTAASNGSVNSMHDSYTPIGGMITMLQMQLGEVIFGGIGCGLYGMLGFAILTVFIAGLMVGRTPEYLGKKIEPFEMRMAVLVCLATPIAILVGSGIASILPQVTDSLHNTGAHGFSEVLYSYSSCAGNNGSAFAGFNANTPFLNVSLGLVMLFARFVPMVATLAIAGNMVQKKHVAASAGTLPTHNAMFICLLIFVVLLIGALSFFPALALGPIAEFFQMFA
ncbi:potassium-transporting ATPase subunit KdpA [Clostridium sp. BJN0001]|uniref:potassium-transporting ATPase subunit KdpA n=1 Tax=Clostridium sp. BJN0001 TaxID=2930219 RepID=UPI001FD3F7F4|nr:potassium-transporting ATPase subunit KdpA [Clostridium sp. BJN0001]